MRRVRVAPLGDPVEEAVQVDQPVLDADAAQRLAGVAPVLGRDPGLVVLDVAPFQPGAAGHVGMGLREPGAELAQVGLDVLGGSGPQAQLHLGDVAASAVGEGGRDDSPPGDRHRRLRRRPPVGVELAGVEQGELEAVEDRRDVPSRCGGAAVFEGLDELSAGRLEVGGGDRLGGCPRHGGDLGQRGPLQRDIVLGEPQRRALLDEPGVAGRVPSTRRDSQPQVSAHDQRCIGLQPLGGEEPGNEPGRPPGRLQLLIEAHRVPAASPVDTSATGPGRLDRRGPGLHAGPLMRLYEAGDTILGDRAEPERGGHQSTISACASIASDARRYSPASHSLARCR